MQLLTSGGSQSLHKTYLHKLTTQTLLLEELGEKNFDRPGSSILVSDGEYLKYLVVKYSCLLVLLKEF